MAVTANQVVKRQDGCRQQYPVLASTRIYEGTLVFVGTTGYADDDTASGANQFAGVAVKEADNSNGSSGDIQVECYAEGVFELTGTGFAQADLGQTVYATDNFTISTQPGTTGVAIGECVSYTSSTSIGVRISVLGAGGPAGGAGDAQTVTPDDAEGAGNSIAPGVTKVNVTTVTNDANDFIVLPALAEVPIGHEITILCNAGGNFEMRTPATSAEEINSEDCDGTKEYLMTNTQVVKVVKINNTIGWMAHGYSAIGAVVAAVVPD